MSDNGYEPLPLIPLSGSIETVDLSRDGFGDCASQALVLAAFFLYFKVRPVKEALHWIGDTHWVALPLIVATFFFLIWWLGRRFGPRGIGEYARRQGKTLAFLFMAVIPGFVSDGGRDFRGDWWIWSLAVPPSFVVAIGMAEIHRSSKLRRFWRKEARSWLWLVLSVEAGILLAFGLAFFEPRLLALNPLGACSLLIVGLSFAYLASRQPLAEGASS